MIITHRNKKCNNFGECSKLDATQLTPIEENSNQLLNTSTGNMQKNKSFPVASKWLYNCQTPFVYMCG